MMTIDARTMTGIYAIVSLVNRQNDRVDALHVDKLDRYAKKKQNQKRKTK